MAFGLTNPGLAIPQPPQIDPVTGMQVELPPMLKFFKNPDLRAQDYAAEAGKAIDAAPVQAVPSQVSGVTAGSGDQPPDVKFSGGGLNLGSPVLPKPFQPSYQSTLTDQNGLPTPVNPAQTKLGKLLAVVKAVTEGGLAGSSQGTFGGGFEAAKQAPYVDLSNRLGAEGAILQNEQQKANLAMLPWQRAAQIQAIQRGNYLPTPRSGVFDVRTGKPVPGTEPPDPNQTSDQLVLGSATRIQQGIGTPEDIARVAANKQILETKQEVKPDTQAKAKDAFQTTMAKVAGEGLLKPEAYMSLPKMTAAVNGSKSLSAAEKQSALAYLAANSTPASQGSMANLRIEGLGDTRGVQQVLDTQTGIVGPATWDQINSNPGRYTSPQFGITGERQKFLTNYENPNSRSSMNRQAINNILQHASDLSDLNQAYRRTDVRFLNTPINKIANQFGSTAFTNFQTTASVLKDELSLYFAGGYAPQGEQIGKWNKILAEEATPAQVESFAKEVIHLGFRRASTFNSGYKKTMGYDDPNMITPDAKAAAEKLGMGDEVKKFGSGGQYGTNPLGGTAPPPVTPPPANHPIGFVPL